MTTMSVDPTDDGGMVLKFQSGLVIVVIVFDREDVRMHVAEIARVTGVRDPAPRFDA